MSSAHPDVDTEARPGGRTQLDLMTAQLDAVDAWHRARRAVDRGGRSPRP